MQIPSMNHPPPSLFAQTASNVGSAGFGSGYSSSRSMGRYGGYNDTLPPGTESGGGRSR